MAEAGGPLPQRLDIVVAALDPSQPGLDSKHVLFVGAPRCDCLVDLGPSHVQELGYLVPSNHAHRGDVQEGKLPGLGALEYPFAEGGKRSSTG